MWIENFMVIDSSPRLCFSRGSGGRTTQTFRRFQRVYRFFQKLDTKGAPVKPSCENVTNFRVVRLFISTFKYYNTFWFYDYDWENNRSNRYSSERLIDWNFLFIYLRLWCRNFWEWSLRNCKNHYRITDTRDESTIVRRFPEFSDLVEERNDLDTEAGKDRLKPEVKFGTKWRIRRKS